MRLHVQLIFALFVLHARAASIPDKVLPGIEKKISEAVKEVLQQDAEEENALSEPSLTEQTHAIKDIENKLRNNVKKTDDIPVKVLIEDVQPSLKEVSNQNVAISDVSLDTEDDSDIKRVEIDLKNPGPPQRQEHETQNPEHYDENHTVTTIRQTIKDTQDIFNQGLQGITQGLQNWFTNNEQIATIQENIQNLQNSFTGQISKLNQTIQGIWKPSDAGEAPPDAQISIKNVETGLKVLENNFEVGVKSLASGVQTLATLKADNATNASGGSTANPSPVTPSNPFGGGLFTQYLQMFQHTIVEGFNNVTNAIQSYVNQNQSNNSSTSSSPGFFQGIGQGLQNIIGQNGQQNKPPAGAQSDDASPSRPTIWSGIQSSLQNIPNGPIAQAIQNNPLVQGVVNLIQPKPPASTTPISNPPAKPAEEKPIEKPSETPSSNDQEGSNIVPASDEKPTAESTQTQVQQQDKQPEPQSSTNTPNGPIQQIIQRNPLVQGIAGAVQRIQSSITNPEKPRDAIKQNGEKVSGVEKFGYVIHHGHHHHGGSDSEHNNNGDGVAKNESVNKPQEPIPAEPSREEDTKEKIENVDMVDCKQD